MSGIGGGIADLGGAVSDFFGAAGSNKAASSYNKAADIALGNEALTKRSTVLNVAQESIQTYQALGTESAQTAGAGFETNSGSAADLLRSSAQQAALTKGITETQGEITAKGYEEQGQAYKGQAEAAKIQVKGQGAGGLFGAIAGVASIFGF